MLRYLHEIIVVLEQLHLVMYCIPGNQAISLSLICEIVPFVYICTPF